MAHTRAAQLQTQECVSSALAPCTRRCRRRRDAMCALLKPYSTGVYIAGRSQRCRCIFQLCFPYSVFSVVRACPHVVYIFTCRASYFQTQHIQHIRLQCMLGHVREKPNARTTYAHIGRTRAHPSRELTHTHICIMYTTHTHTSHICLRRITTQRRNGL